MITIIIVNKHLTTYTHRWLGPAPRASDSVGLELVLREVAHQTGSWVMLLFVVQEPHMENTGVEDVAGALPRCTLPNPMCSEQNHTT